MMRTSTLTGWASPSGCTSCCSMKRSSLGWSVEPDVANLVEEQGAAVGAADDAGERGVGAGEGALAVAEQLALEHVARNRGAVEGDERAVGAVRGAMDHAREHLLAGAGLAGEEDRQGARGQPAGEVHELDGLLGDPQALGVALEGLGRPQRRALLLVAAVLVEGAGGGDELADGGEGAAMVELRPRAREDLPGLVAVLAEEDEVVLRGRAQGRERLVVGPAVAGDEPHAARAAGARARAPRRTRSPAGWRTPRGRECAGGPRVRGAPPPSRGDRIPLCLLWLGLPNPRPLVSPHGYVLRRLRRLHPRVPLIALAL